MAKTGALSSELRNSLLQYLTDRLAAGEVIVTAEQFQRAASEGYELLTGTEAGPRARRRLEEFIAAAHEEDPSQLLVPGLENWIALTVLGQVRQSGWGLAEVQDGATQLIRDLLRTDKARALLAQMGVKVQMVNMKSCERTVINKVARKRDDAQRQSAARLAQLAEAAQRRTEEAAQEKALQVELAMRGEAGDGSGAEGGVDPETQHAEAQERLDGLLLPPTEAPDEAEADERRASEAAARKRIRVEQIDALIANLDNYVARGRITEEDADRLRNAYELATAALRSSTKEPSTEEASKVRNSVLEGTVRGSVERSIKKAVDYAVAYLQVFRAMRRIDERFDPGLRFLVEHAAAINADADPDKPSPLGPAVEALAGDADLMHLLIDVMDRKEAEVRMMAAHLPPYNQVLKRDQLRVERVAIDLDFMDGFRETTAEELSKQMHSSDKTTRARPAAALLSLVVLIGRVFKPTPFRKELRMLKIHMIIEEFYHATHDVEYARQQAQDFLKGRLRRLYPDLDPEETEELQRRGEELVKSVEKRVLAERKAAAGGTKPGAAAGDPEDLTEEERKRGAMVVRIPTRIAGRERNVRHIIMPEEGTEESYVVARRDLQSGELKPVVRRGKPRHVTRGRDGDWEMARE